MRSKLEILLSRSVAIDALELESLYNELPDSCKAYTNKAFEKIIKIGIRGLGELSAAELAIKLTRWLVENKSLA